MQKMAHQEQLFPSRSHIRFSQQSALVQLASLQSLEKSNHYGKRLLVMIVFTACICLLEFGFGLWSGSLALFADALHMLGDLLALLVGLFAVRSSKVPRSEMRTFGLARMEIVGAMFNGSFLIASVLFIVIEAIGRLLKSEVGVEDNIELVLIVGSIGLAFNLIGIVMFSGGHSHGHGHSHGDSNNSEEKEEKPTENLNMQGVLLHVIGDALGSIAVVVSAVVIQYTTWEQKWIVDPLCSLFISVILLSGAIPLVKKSAEILLQSAPQSITTSSLVQSLKPVEGLKDVHEVHIWQLSSDVIVTSMHIVITDDQDPLVVVDRVKSKIHSLGIHSITIQPERMCHDSAHENHPFSLEKEFGSNPCHDPVCSEECLQKLCCPLDPIADVQEKRDDKVEIEVNPSSE
jgi:zinc transporter 1